MDKTSKWESFINKWLNDKAIRVFLFVFSVTGIFLWILYLNVKTPLLGDDLTYTFIFNTTQKIQNLNDIIISQYEHYYTWGGRSVVHTIAQLLLLLPPLLMDIINTLGFLGLVFLVYFHINYKRSFSVSLFIAVFLLIWFLEPFAETILWITGSANYMWGTIIILLFLLPYRIYEGKQNKPYLIFFESAGMFLSGIVAGWTNENTATGMLVSIFLFLCYYKSIQLKIPKWAYWGLAGGLIGYIIMISAPGNAVRAAEVETGFFLIIYRLFRHTQTLLNYQGLLILLVIILITYSYKNGNKKPVSLSYIYLAAMFISVYSMVLSPAFPERAWFGAITFIIISLGLLVVNISLTALHYIKYGCIILGFLIFSFNIFDVYRDVNEVEKKWTERKEIILAAKQEGKELVIIEPYHTRTKYSVADPLYSAPLMSLYYDIRVEYNK